nr:polypyrimidine tract-binding protein homolog 1-like isoform X2 [Ziziphus jujuba var. spinosa]
MLFTCLELLCTSYSFVRSRIYVQVFSAFGFVHKIATFEKAAGFQALIQFSDSDTASSARNALDGRSIPRYLLPEHLGSCHLRISYSAHTDLNIKFQSHRSRDYTNPYLPVNPTAIEGIVQPALGPDGKKKEPESNVLLASIENMQYAVTVDVLHTVFSAFGTVQKIAIFEKNGQTQALVQYPDLTTAAVAREALEGHCIYDGGYCKLHLSYSRHTDLNVKAFSDKSRDYTIPDASLLAAQQASSLPPAPPVWQNPQSAQMYPGNDFGATAAAHAQIPRGQVASWDPNMQAGRLTFVPAASSYPSQNFAAASVPAYATAATSGGSLPLSQRSPITSGVPSSVITQPGVPPNLRPGGASPPGVQPGGVSPPGQSYYGQ